MMKKQTSALTGSFFSFLLSSKIFSAPLWFRLKPNGLASLWSAALKWWFSWDAWSLSRKNFAIQAFAYQLDGPVVFVVHVSRVK